MEIPSFPAHLHKNLKNYVYVYRDPRNDEVFYVGKGKGNRAFSHLSDTSERRKAIRIKDIRDAGAEPKIEILTHGLEDDEVAFKVEAAIIDLLGFDVLTNDVRGRGTREYGVMSVSQIRSRYDAAPVKIVDPVCLVRVNELFRYGMSEQELYDSTRGIWRISPRERNPIYAMAVFDKVVQEVYRIAGWFRAGETMYASRPDIAERLLDSASERCEFVGTIADEKIRKKYCHKSVSEYLSKHSQNPVLYVNC